ncbi:aminotransferase class I/II-fold pyridoxal phosphate-dependent enzyme [Streptomyces sp. NPDC060064]|uniref:aminotransferase class I/II-fold pyridoxal phosphate-dependent enzyme n=1 Tax=Streptomyces sp. NPDC060064 TaxID=3347049 RepID=UPI0036B5A94A
MAPAIRLGWVLCPPALADAVAELKRRHDRGCPELDQLALAALIESGRIESGRYDRHVRRMRTVYAQRHAALVESLTEHAPEVRLTGLAAGFRAVAHLPRGADEQSVITAARARSVGLYGMSPHRSSGATDPAQLILGFGNLGERAVRAGIEATGGLLRGDGAGSDADNEAASVRE